MDASDLPMMTMGMAFGAGGGAIIASLIGSSFLQVPLMIIGGVAGLAAGAGYFGPFDPQELFS